MFGEDFVLDALRFADALIGPLGTILLIALWIGLICAAIGLTIAVLWRYFSLGFQIAVLRAWNSLRAHISETAQRYFRRIRRYGHTVKSCIIAVVCSLALWLALVAAFAFSQHWRVSVVILLLLPFLFFYAGWRSGGPRAPNHRVRFTYAFFEPAVALGVPTLFSKAMDAGLKALAGGI
jgi:hypothetical protein